MVWRGEVRHGTAGHGKARAPMAHGVNEKTNLNEARSGVAWRGWVRPGAVGFGRARRGKGANGPQHNTEEKRCSNKCSVTGIRSTRNSTP